VIEIWDPAQPLIGGPGRCHRPKLAHWMAVSAPGSNRRSMRKSRPRPQLRPSGGYR